MTRQEHILALACAQLSALVARFLDHDEDGRGHSLNLLFAELDAFKARFYTLSSLAEPQYIHALSSQSSDIKNNLDLSLAFCEPSH